MTPSPANRPSEAPAALAAAVVAAAKQADAGQPDPLVLIAVALGWQMAEIYRPDLRAATQPANDDDLPGLSRLDVVEWREIGLYQVEAGITKLREAITRAGLRVPNAQHFADVLRETSDSERPGAIRRFHVDLLSTLTAADFRLGKAYGLGRALADTTRDPNAYQAELRTGRVQMLAAWIRELATAFPPHAAHAVADSLETWSRWAGGSPDPDEGIRRQLSAQGLLWRSLLSGEKHATDMLEPIDYITAGERASQNTGRLARRFVSHYRLALAAVVAILVLAVFVMFAAGNAPAIVTGAAAILASLGVTWKGVGSSLGKSAAGVELPLWGAALDRVIYERITPQQIIAKAGPRPEGPDDPSLVAAADGP